MGRRWSRGHKAQDQGHKKYPRPKTALSRRDPFKGKDAGASVLKKNYKIFKNLFQAFNKKIFKSFFQVISKKQNQKISKKQIILQKNDLQNFKDSKNTDVLELRTGQFSRT